MAVSVVFFANDEAHARDVFRRMLEFRLDHARKQGVYYNEVSGVHHDKYSSREKKTMEMVEDWLSRIDEAVFTEAPTNQFFTVGWAFNDTIL